MQVRINNGDGGPSTSRPVTTTVEGSHNFLISGYSLAKGMGVGRHICSETFSVGGYQWAIYFYPDGINAEDNSLYVSVFIALESEDQHVRVSYELTLVDQSEEGKHKKWKGKNKKSVGHENGRSILRYKRFFENTALETRTMWGYKRFFKRTALETSDYLKNDCLKINCKLVVNLSASEYARLHSAAVPAPAPESELGSQFGALLENQEASDVIFHVGGQKFHAHKLVLAARSPVFRANFFDSSEQNNEVAITEMEPRVFKAMLHYIYRDTLPDEEPSSPNSSSSSTTETFTERLIAAADAYGLPRLRLLCESKLWRNISVDTFASTVALAESCHATDLKTACLDFAARNLPEVMRSEGFEYLKENFPLLHSELLETAASFQRDWL